MSGPEILHRGSLVAGRAGATRLSIILPVKNGETDLPHLLAAIRAQQIDAEVELVAIDSGSTDRSVEILRQHGATVLSIEPETFDYGLTRNLAVVHAAGELYVFITVRARPSGPSWLANLIAPLRNDPSIATTFSCVLPRPDTDLLTARDQLRARRPAREVRQVPLDDLGRLDRDALLALVSFHNVSCAIRASVFAQIPFRQSTYGEDMRWAREVLEAGFAIQYEPSSVVFHSHNYSWEETFYRGFDDGIGHREAIGARFEPDDLLTTVASMVFDDWRLMAEGWQLRGEELRSGLLHSLRKRSAWAVGRWLGSHNDRLGSDPDSLIAFMGSETEGTALAPHVERFAAAFSGSDDSGGDREAMLQDATLDRPDLEVVHQALTTVACLAGQALRRCNDLDKKELSNRFSLISRVRSGVKTGEMLAPHGGVPAHAPPYARDGGDVWIDPYRPAVAALQIELALMFNKATEAHAWGASAHRRLAESDETITRLQLDLDAASTAEDAPAPPQQVSLERTHGDQIDPHSDPEQRSVEPAARDGSDIRRNRVAVIAIILLIVIGSLRIASTWQIFSETVDEAAHVATGMELIDQGTYTLELLHPPLARLAVAVGPWLLGSGYGGERWLWTEGGRILHERGEYRVNLAAARAGTLVFFILAALVVAAWAWWTFGRFAAIAAVAFFSSDPTVLAHSGLATTDMAAAAGVAAALWAFARWLEKTSLARGLILGAAVGVAIASKFTPVLFVAAVFPLFLLWKAAIERRAPAITRRGWLSLVAGLALSALVVWAAHFFSFGTIEDRAERSQVKIETLFEWAPAAIRERAIRLPLPAPEFPLGLEIFRHNNEKGRKSYLFGQISTESWPYYFPVAVGLKTTLPLLVLGIVSAVLLARRRRRDWREGLPLLAIAMIFIALVPARAGLGVRHVLAVYPLLAIAAGAATAMLFRSRRGVVRSAVVVLVLWQGVESGMSHPDYLAYFNQLGGRHPERLLTDSNLDWGQDLLRLEEELRRRNIKTFRIKYHGGATLKLFDLPPYQPLPPRYPVNGWAAISETSFTGLIESEGSFSWLERYEPVTIVGRSIRLYYIDDVPPPDGLEIKALHPSGTTAGVGFNMQWNGSSALGVAAANAHPSTVIVFDGREMETAFGGPDSLSTLIDAELYARPGQYKVELRDGEHRTAALDFVVTPP
ncbi:MAG TPA: glycosyltransferase [Thermoanaerobaculia bacterium]